MQARVQKVVSFSKNYLKTLKLVWQTSPTYTFLATATVILASLIPATQTYLGKLIIDRVVSMIGKPINFEFVQPVLILILLAFVLGLCEWLLRSAQNIFGDLLTDLALNRINVLVLEKAVSLDLVSFENSEFYDKLEKIRRESNHRPIRLLFDTSDLLEYAITAFSMFALLLSFGQVVLLLLILVSIPRFFYYIAYSRKKYFITDSRVPESRKVWYLSWLLSSDRNIKEVKLFDLGKHFLKEYQRL
ncbi:MAG: ABC transporter ATP-binding protein, partial [Candidatus Cloacimonetes bacterium]|nr:ABC transporter ATP-binding protein [Candidatus Cloacimonadota bacterium]